MRVNNQPGTALACGHTIPFLSFAVAPPALQRCKEKTNVLVRLLIKTRSSIKLKSVTQGVRLHTRYIENYVLSLGSTGHPHILQNKAAATHDYYRLCMGEKGWLGFISASRNSPSLCTILRETSCFLQAT